MKALTLIDWKSSRSIYPEMITQVVAYAEAYNLDAEDKVTDLMVLRLDKETGMPDPQVVTDGWPDRFASFSALRRYYYYNTEKGTSDDKKRTGGGRYYQYKDGRLFPSVTTILGVTAKPALIPWAANMAVEYIESNLEEIVSQETTPARRAQILKKAKSAHRDVAKKAADTGGLVHDAIECYFAGGDPASIIGTDEKAEKAFLAFTDWKLKVRLEVVALEQPVFHHEMEYAGCPDLVAWIDTDKGGDGCTSTG